MADYKTVRAAASGELTEKRSRFIGYCKPVSTEEEATAFIASIRSRHWDARHNVYAYSLREGNLRRYSDDGEPSGTAGMPVLDVLQKSGVTDVCVVVTRYFGGVLLGTGGLVRAYSQAARLGLNAAQGVILSMNDMLDPDTAWTTPSMRRMCCCASISSPKRCPDSTRRSPTRPPAKSPLRPKKRRIFQNRKKFEK